MTTKYVAAIAAALVPATAQSLYGQCGGTGWTGGTTCPAGSSCVAANSYYSQCLPGSAGSAPGAPSTTLATSTVPAPTGSTGAAGSTFNFNTLAKAAGKKYFGTATDFYGTPAEASDRSYQAILNDTAEFGQQTPGNAQKFAYSEPTQGQFNFAPGDAAVAYAKANNQMVRCHNLIWYSQLPSWLTSQTWTSADNQTMQGIMEEHISSMISHYGSSCYAWDVVNEPLNDDATGSMRSSPFYDAIGPEYFPLAFKFASAAAAKVTPTPPKLYVNEYNIEYAGAKATSMLNLVNSVKAQGIQLDGVGFESHFIVGETPDRTSQTAVKNQFTAAGVEVAITELDVRFSSLPPTSSQLTQQATDYANSVGSCVDVTGCVGVTIWDFDDKYSWVPSTFSGQGEACVYNQDLTPKPAAQSIVSVLS